jgi:hypothetical protein
MPSSVSISVDGFRQALRKEVDALCKDLGKPYDKEGDRGYAFELWVANLLIAEYEIDAEPSTCTFISNDLKIDVAFDDDESKSLVLAQTKFVSVSSNPDILEDDVITFFDRHDVFMKQAQWVREHSSDELHDLIADYPDKVAQDWNVNFFLFLLEKLRRE